jgi:hypothetical protein
MTMPPPSKPAEQNEPDWLDEILEKLHEHGKRCYCEDQEKGITRSEAKAAISAHMQAECEKARLKGYNSGWVKANRLTQKPEAIEYFANQLEAAAATLREAISQDRPR